MVHFRHLIYYKSSSSKTKDRQLKTRNREKSYPVYSSVSHILKVAKILLLENEQARFHSFYGFEKFKSVFELSLV